MASHENTIGHIGNKVSLELSDWSATGRGSHIDFQQDETIPLAQGQFLGRGAMGEVHETTIKGHKLAWKRMAFRRKIGEAERKEIEILKKLSHIHMIQLVGTYTHRQFLGLLLFPVAVCDLHTFFEDVEAYWHGSGLDDQQQARLTALDYFSQCRLFHQASPIYYRIGCLISAIAYLHNQKIRHKDLKPSNILLVRGGFYLSDFGSATDFSLLSQSSTDNERGTPRYYAPEVAEWKPNGRAADMFSLGCVLLEIVILHWKGTLELIRRLRTSRDTAFHANLDNIDKWLADGFAFDRTMGPRGLHLLREIRGMLAQDPKRRPTAQELLKGVESCEGWGTSSNISLFGDCCRIPHFTIREHTEAVILLEQKIQELNQKLGSTQQALKDSKSRENYLRRINRRFQLQEREEDEEDEDDEDDEDDDEDEDDEDEDVAKPDHANAEKMVKVKGSVKTIQEAREKQKWLYSKRKIAAEKAADISLQAVSEVESRQATKALEQSLPPFHPGNAQFYPPQTSTPFQQCPAVFPYAQNHYDQYPYAQNPFSPPYPPYPPYAPKSLSSMTGPAVFAPPQKSPSVQPNTPPPSRNSQGQRRRPQYIISRNADGGVVIDFGKKK